MQNSESCLVWPVYNGGSYDNVVGDDATMNDTKYSVFKNTSGLYYRLYLLNVGVSDMCIDVRQLLME